MPASSNSLVKAARWLWRLAAMPHRITETLIRTRAIEILLSQQHAPSPAPPAADFLEIYRGYSDADAEMVRRYAGNNKPHESVPGYVVDFLGVRTRTTYVNGSERLDGTVTGAPLPSDGWHAEAIEYVGLLKSVDTAQGSYTAMELGAGWGPWVVAGAYAAQQRGIANIKLCAAEVDHDHFRFLVQHFRDNRIDPFAHDLIEAAVGVAPGVARLPKLLDPSADWGSRPRHADELGDVDYVGRKRDSWMEVRIVPFQELLRKQPRWDLVHMDVQGWEVELCTTEIELLEARVKWLVVATHDAKLHGDMIGLLFGRGWILENEKPPRFTWTSGAPSLIAMTAADGTQVWRNPRIGTASSA